MDAVRPQASSATVSAQAVVTFHPPTLVGFAIRRAASLSQDDRLALADRLERLPPPDDAAGRLIARRLRHPTS